ncbi:hypothetical protein [Paraburkholderia sediminicola]|uniref:hypothetical protein n=1 Tax=Paraburkholderia sediminicola TaxID=458836 RepID=UPI0038BDECBC
MENTKEIFDRLMQTTIDEALVVDAIELYAQYEFDNDAEREEFVDTYSDDQYQPVVKGAVLDVVVVIVAAHEVANDEAYRTLVNMLDCEEENDVVRRMKLVMLEKMVDDAVGDLPDHLPETRFRERMQYFQRCIG